MRSMLLLVSLALPLGACSSEHYGDIHEREAHWRSRIASELQPGATLAKATGFFTRSGLEYIYDKQSRTLRAIERDVTDDGIVSFSVTIACQFDTSATLVACSVSSIGTGP